MNQKSFIITFTSIVLLFCFLVEPAKAKGPFDTTCPTCNGSGQITTTQTCTTCQGTGSVEPDITKKSMNGYGTLVGLDWVARVEGVFHNEEDVGTYGVARSEVHTVTTTYYHTSARTYLPPHQDVTITIDTPEITFGEDWTYTIYLYSVDSITCPDCGGTGAKSVLSTCPTCNGSGYVTNWTVIWTTIIAAAVAVVAVVGIATYALRKKKTAPKT